MRTPPSVVVTTVAATAAREGCKADNYFVSWAPGATPGQEHGKNQALPRTSRDVR